MPQVDRIWIGIFTQTDGDSGTDDDIEIVINDSGIDRLRRTIGETGQDDLEAGGANLYTFDTAGNNIVSENLTDSSIRVAIKGADQWCPEDIFVWGRLANGEVIPLSIETDITTPPSTGAGEGATSIPLRRVGMGDRAMQINRLFMLMLTSAAEDAGTDDTITLQIVTTGLVVDFDVPPGGDTTQEDLEGKQANFYEVPVITPFTKNDLATMTLRINGDDAWLPSSFFLFGLDDATGRPELLVPLVSLPSWPFGNMSTDSSEGVSSVQLPLAPTP